MIPALAVLLRNLICINCKIKFDDKKEIDAWSPRFKSKHLQERR